MSTTQPTSASASTTTPTTTATPPTATEISQKFDLSISLLLHLWPALTTAVSESWGGPDSSGKRDWFAGAISDLFAARPETDEEDVEDMLVQVMGDEFECVLEDGSEVGVAREICRMKRVVERGAFGEVEELYRVWEGRRGKGAQARVVVQSGEEEEDDEDDSDGDEDEDEEDGGVDVDGEGDVEMGGTSASSHAPREKPAPEVDEDGFTKVVSKKKR